jgi:hypothetical protein
VRPSISTTRQIQQESIGSVVKKRSGTPFAPMYSTWAASQNDINHFASFHKKEIKHVFSYERRVDGSSHVRQTPSA